VFKLRSGQFAGGQPVATPPSLKQITLLMKVKLRARGLWTVVEKGGGDVQEHMMALDALSSAVPPEMI
jgi:hypothetical protein